MLRIAFVLLAVWNLSAMSYHTNFPAAENPISQGGKWLNGAVDGVDWCNVQTSVGYAWGVGPCPVEYADPTAVLKGEWGPNQVVQATAKIGTVNPTYWQEIELRLRTRVSPHRITGYEVIFAVSHDYVQIVRWNGPLADFTYLGSTCNYPEVCGKVNGFTIRNGDVARAVISGNTIKAYVNGVLLAIATDTTFADGNPGVGYNFGCDGTYSNAGWTNFEATDSLPEK